MQFDQNTRHLIVKALDQLATTSTVRRNGAIEARDPAVQAAVVALTQLLNNMEPVDRDARGLRHVLDRIEPERDAYRSVLGALHAELQNVVDYSDDQFYVREMIAHFLTAIEGATNRPAFGGLPVVEVLNTLETRKNNAVRAMFDRGLSVHAKR